MEIESILDNLIFDRVQADVDYALSLRNSGVYTDENLRGAYNISDRNRVGRAINWLISALNLVRFSAKDSWTVNDIADFDDNANTLACLDRLQKVLPFGEATIVPADLDKLSYQKANDVERILYEVGDAFLWTADAAIFVGDGYASDFDAVNKQVFDM